MNNYVNMDYFMPEEYMFMMGAENVYDPNYVNKANNKGNFDQKLAQKLKVQAGDNMNFNKANYTKQVSPNELYDVYNGFIRGNMFPDLYNTYKITKPFDIKPGNEQAELLTYIDAYCFGAHDLNLYLDTNPNDRAMIDLFNQYTNEANNLIKQYEGKYGPLFVDGSAAYPWAWNNSPWPWENK